MLRHYALQITRRHINLRISIVWDRPLADPWLGLLGPGPPTPNMWEIFKAKEFTMSANQI